METQITKKSIMLNYGLLLGVSSIIVALLNYVIGDIYQPHWSVMVGSLIITSAIIVLGLKKQKEANEGLLSLSEAIKIGLGISLISALVYIVYLVIFFNVIEPDYFTNMIKFQEQMIAENYPNLTDEQLEGAQKNAAMFANTGVNLTMTLIVSLFFGLIISLIAGLVMKQSEEDL